MPGETTPTFSDLRVLVIASSFTAISAVASDVTIGFAARPGWTAIGPPETDSLAGVSPDDPLPIEPLPMPAGIV